MVVDVCPFLPCFYCGLCCPTGHFTGGWEVFCSAVQRFYVKGTAHARQLVLDSLQGKSGTVMMPLGCRLSHVEPVWSQF